MLRTVISLCLCNFVLWRFVTLTDYSNEWIIKSKLPKSTIEALGKRYRLIYLEQLSDNLHVLLQTNIPKVSKEKQTLLAKRIQGIDKIESATQMRWRQRYLRTFTRPIDKKWLDMWYLNGDAKPDMSVMETWSDGYTGKGVTIAIVDDGVEYTHPDLRANFNRKLSKDVFDSDNDPLPENRDSHGTKCAGVAASVKNNLCSVGVAYGSTFAAIRVVASVNGAYSTTEAGESRALQANLDKIDIYSNSWGGADGTTFTGPSRNVNDAIINGIRNGRGKLGAIYVWAGGNGGYDDNCNCDGYVNSIFTIGINTVSQQHGLLGDAERCSAIMTTAFSGEPGQSNSICTTNTNKGCTSQFSGTSAAAPMAAGVIALALEANPTLTWRDVQHIIVHSSDSASLQNGDFQSNGAGIKVSDWYGFGLLNALKMTNMSESWKLVPNQHVCNGKETIFNGEIKASTPPHLVSSEFISSGCKRTNSAIKFLEHVEVQVTFRYSFRGAVQITLESPAGTASRLLTRRNYDKKANSKQQWTFMSVQHWGEDPTGIWRLNMSLVQDQTETGILEKWKLILYGTKTDPALGRGNEPNAMSSALVTTTASVTQNGLEPNALSPDLVTTTASATQNGLKPALVTTTASATQNGLGSSLEPHRKDTTVKVVDQTNAEPDSTVNHTLMLVLIGVGVLAIVSFSIAAISVIRGYYHKRRKIDKLEADIITLD